jgi:glycosyltransferase involved in cell wall biosynthesis
MSVYNCERYVSDTIHSVIDQSFTNWEFIIIDDCSSDQSASIIENIAKEEPRIRFIRNTENKGQCANLDYGISLARGKYIARLDHDDICYPQRFKVQYDYMEEHDETVMVGCGIDLIYNGNIRHFRTRSLEYSNSRQLRLALLFTNPIAHSTFFIRKDVLKDNNICYGKFNYAEDMHMILELSEVGAVIKLPNVLVAYRESDQQLSIVSTYQDEGAQIRQHYVNKLNLPYNDAMIKAIAGNICTSEDLKLFTASFSAWVDRCMDKDNKQDQNFAKKLYTVVCYGQKCNINILFEYLHSEKRERLYIFSTRFALFAYLCIFGRNRGNMFSSRRTK